MNKRFKIPRFTLTTLLATFFLTVTAGASAETECDGVIINPPYRQVDFDRDIQPFFDRECVSCHQPDGAGFSVHRLDLRLGQSYRNLVNVPSAQDPLLIRVIPFDPDISRGSLLWEKVTCDRPSVGGRMPSAFSRIDGLDALALYAWMVRGAPPGGDGAERNYAIEPDLSGTWYDPSVPGQGFFFEVVERSPPLVVAYWATFSQTFTDLDSGDAGVSKDLRWMTGLGEYQPGDSSVTLQVQRHVYGLFDEPALPPTPQTLGAAVLNFQSCSEATLRYDIKLDNEEAQRVQRTIVLRRLTPRASCTTPAAPTSFKQANTIGFKTGSRC